MKNTLLGILTLVSVCSLSYAAWMHFERGAESAGTAQAVPSAAGGGAQREAELRDRIRSLEFELATLRNRLATLADTSTVESGTPEEGLQARAPGGEPRRGPPAEFWRGRAQEIYLNALRTDPDVALLARLDRQREVDDRYADFFRLARLTPQQAERVRALLTTREIARRTAPLTAREAGVDPEDSAAMGKYLSQILEPIQLALQQELGPGGWQQMESYEAALPYKSTLDRLARRLGYGGAPLGDLQRESLARILVSAPVSPERPNPRAPDQEWEEYFQRVAAADAAIVARSRAVLTPQQAEVFAAQRAEDLRRQQLRMKVGRTMRAAREAAAGMPPRD